MLAAGVAWIWEELYAEVGSFVRICYGLSVWTELDTDP